MYQYRYWNTYYVHVIPARKDLFKIQGLRPTIPELGGCRGAGFRSRGPRCATEQMWYMPRVSGTVRVWVPGTRTGYCLELGTLRRLEGGPPWRNSRPGVWRSYWEGGGIIRGE